MKHLIMGTAGHVDHGKTSLIKALTGIDCDTHKQEKQRGVTINLGFAHLPLPGGDKLGIVDVPGHRDFIHTAVGGASGIDFTLLAVAADSGVMPQTREHLQIMDTLGIRGGLVAVTRIDLAEPDLVEMAAEEIRDFVAGSFLDGCPVVPVSSVTGQGIEDLKLSIADVAARCENRSADGVFRLFADRIFTVSGFGTVVAGSVISGKLHVGDTAYLLPGAKKPLRVRRLERYGEEVEQVVAGDRAAMNLAGLDHTDLARGQVISDCVLRDTTRLDARLRLFQHDRKFGIWNHVDLHLGTYERQAKIHLLDRDVLAGGETALVQIHLDTPCVIRQGDRFIVRSTSSDLTLGGGEVLDAAPLHHRRRPPQLIEGLTRLADGGLAELVSAELRKHAGVLTREQIADILSASPGEVHEALAQCRPGEVVCRQSGEQSYLIHGTVDDRLKQRSLEILGDFHRQNPLTEKGRTTDELVGLLGLGGDSATVTARLILAGLEAEGKVKTVGRTWARADHSVDPGPKLQREIESMAQHIEQCGMDVPRMTDLLTEAAQQGIDEATLDQILRYLVEREEVCFADGIYVRASVVAACREKLLRALAGRDEGMTVAEFRDLVAGNRKVCLTLLSLYDAEGVTRREGDRRVLTASGRKIIEA